MNWVYFIWGALFSIPGFIFGYAACVSAKQREYRRECEREREFAKEQRLREVEATVAGIKAAMGRP